MGYHTMFAVVIVYLTLCFFSGSNCVPLDEIIIVHKKQTTTVGQSSTLSCHVGAALLAPVNWWYKSLAMSAVTEICVNGDLVNGNRKRFTLDKITYDLTLDSPTLDDSGNYTCVEDHGFGTRHITQLHVKVAEPIFFNHDQSATVGQLITIPCHSGTLTAAVNWLFRRSSTEPQTEIYANESVHKFEINPTNYSLTIPEFKPEYAGIYTCVEEAGFGASHVTRLTERGQNAQVLAHNYYLVVVGVLIGFSCSLLLTMIAMLIAFRRECRSATRRNGRDVSGRENATELLNQREFQPEQSLLQQQPQRKWFAKTTNGEKTWTSHTFSMSNQQGLLACIEDFVQHLKQAQYSADAIVGMSSNPEDALTCAMLSLKLNIPCVAIESSCDSSRDDVLRGTYLSHNKETVLELVTDACRPEHKLIVVGSATANLSRMKASIALIQRTGANVVEYVALGRGETMRPAVWSLFASQDATATGVGNSLNDDSQPNSADPRPTDVA